MQWNKIVDFKNGLNITGFYLIKSGSVRTSTTGKSMYGDYMLYDETGEINAKLWDVVDAQQCPEVGGIVKIQGTVTEWQNKLQLRIDRFRDITEQDEVDVELLVPSAPEKAQDMLDEIRSYMLRIEDEEIRNIVEYLLEEHEEKLLIWPAAVRNHHSMRSGLLYHMINMLRMGEHMAQVYDLNRDLLFSGVILHDIAKIEELDVANTGIATQYSVPGQLLGHITMGVVAVDRAGVALGINQEKVMLLQHMLLAHHYEPEFGSPRRPMFPEAEALHFLDILDAHMFDMRKAVQDIPENSFSERIFSMHNRQIYHIRQNP